MNTCTPFRNKWSNLHSARDINSPYDKHDTAGSGWLRLINTSWTNKHLCPVWSYLCYEWWHLSFFSSANLTAQEIKRNKSQMEIHVTSAFYFQCMKVNKNSSAFRVEVFKHTCQIALAYLVNKRWFIEHRGKKKKSVLLLKKQWKGS